MGLLSKFKSRSPDAARAGASPADANEVVRDVRARARRRLIGAALLLGVGIIGFPLLFETQPRPIAVDIPIEIPSRDNVSPLRSPASRPARNPQAAAARPPAEVPAASQPAEPAPKPVAVAPTEPKLVEAKPVEPKPDAKPENKPDAKPAPKPAEPAAADSGRFVVQIGAFAEATGAREARMKVEGMGLKTYTQVIESASGRRIRVRVGPYATKAEAEKAAARIKAGGLQAAVLTL
jgi:DedD protein